MVIGIRTRAKNRFSGERSSTRSTRCAARCARFRRVNPAARLIQTEDLGRTYATSSLSHQAEFDNQRRWMTWDLLCGRVDAHHPFWERLDRVGLGDRGEGNHRRSLPSRGHRGVNHYLTSDRFLDPRLERYPDDRHGGNGSDLYADVEAIRVMVPGPDLIAGAIDEAWKRYGIPVAITEGPQWLHARRTDAMDRRGLGGGAGLQRPGAARSRP